MEWILSSPNWMYTFKISHSPAYEPAVIQVLATFSATPWWPTLVSVPAARSFVLPPLLWSCPAASCGGSTTNVIIKVPEPWTSRTIKVNVLGNGEGARSCKNKTWLNNVLASREQLFNCVICRSLCAHKKSINIFMAFPLFSPMYYIGWRSNCCKLDVLKSEWPNGIH